ncbi:prepilin-type N-terminal cleavage/methylation domain-containing protein [Biomaibacter acetigenes]|jgi:prepilin-type N-terminal cleavage/methylation domain-containing protein|uniref:Prepilin-type N-terminal cleavage/methylation domain-containing protein n=1 Tax=Biomaibacter acetigenes TaxID=2316383 RepID=A0A3G2R5Q4_9FIRM|nr:prepilin-type N-terminal cleavage/methylation domain-containing protein [Biomaibacter acetigenes]AYO30721.1 prepilin-type N-terminal cleavage/methylation domain-containing protein [Biomaibacter acetigenes]RKL64241.1 prepilin-type N-terminal cleavage/methylation domain-containing protein [Thermoanaerobacteraceae bacterium SP2]
MLLLKNTKGFSLVELLVTIGLVSLVITAASLAYFSGVKAWVRSGNQVEVQQNLRIAMNTLSDEIQMADTININTAEKRISLLFDDGSTRSYYYDSASKEIRLAESGSTVAMYIIGCDFEYSNNLISISLTTEARQGVKSGTYVFRINARGKEVNVQ